MRFLILLSLLPVLAFGQLSKQTMDAKAATTFGEHAKKNTLIIPIFDPEDPEENALIEAFKKHWHFCEYKFIAYKDLEATRSTKDKMHLFFSRNFSYGMPGYVQFSVSKRLEDDPKGKGHIAFNLPTHSENGKDVHYNYSDLYDLMVRSLNHEMELMVNKAGYRNITRKQIRRTIFYNKTKDSVATRDILVSVKDVDSYKYTLRPKHWKHYNAEKYKKQLAKKLRTKPARIYVVYDEDIQHACEIKDKDVWIYTANSLYAPDNGRLIANDNASRTWLSVLLSMLPLMLLGTALLLSAVLTLASLSK